MADTIVNVPEKSGDTSAAGWVVAIVVILAVLIGGFFLLRGTAPAVPNTGPNINVTVPANGTGGTDGTGGSGGSVPSDGSGSGSGGATY